MKFVVMIVGLVFIIIAAIYFGLPAGKLPSFFPGYEVGVDRMHTKHGLLAAVIGLALLVLSVRMRRPAP